MIYSKAAVDMIKRWESLRLEAYMPTPDDVWTIGYGHTEGVNEGDVITEAQAVEYLYQDINKRYNMLNLVLTKTLTQSQLDAIVSLVFNVGVNSFSRSKALKALNRGDYETFKLEAFSPTRGWVYQNGIVLRGLVRRRADEQKLFDNNN